MAGGATFEVVLIFRVADPSRFFEGSEGLVHFLSDDLDSFSTSHRGWHSL
jgi:hypothetical protein